MTQEIFQNGQVDILSLPTADGLTWTPLEDRYRRLLLLSTAFASAVFIAGVSLTLPLMEVPPWVALSAVGIILLIAAIQTLAIVKGFPYKGYAIRTHDLLYRTGWLYKKQIAIPFSRVQHVEIRQGIFERVFGLHRLNVYTAGGDSSDLTIPGLPERTAQRLKEFILRETTTRDEEE